MSGSVHYEYEPLGHPDAIRLCEVLPHPDAALHIQISLSPYRLSDPELDFTALSYTWGDASDKRQIRVGSHGALLQVPSSAVDALMVLRQHGKRRLFWIDAICINQKDMREKTDQVRKMGRIFATASCTTIYLGLHTESSEIVFQELIEASQCPKSKVIFGRVFPDRDPPNEFVIQGLEELIQRPWFQRVWVLQEVLLGRNIQILCGDSIVPKDTLLLCFFGYCGNLVTKMDVPFAIRPDVLREGVMWHKLWEYLHLTRDSLATDPRDRLFALKAFLEPSETDEADPLLTDFDELIDYEKSLEDILLRLALNLLQFLGLRLLVGARHGHTRRLPSWVPDWSQNTSLNWAFFWFSVHEEEEHIEALIQDNFEKYQSQDPHLLSVQGWTYGQIREMGGTYVFNNLEDVERQISRIITITTAERSNGTTQPDASEIMAAGLSRNILDVLQKMDTNEIGALLTRSFEDVPLHKLRPSQVGYTGYVTDMMSALQDCRLAFCGACCVAIVPCSATEGDVLVVIEGAPAPCLIRPSSNGTWSLISGDCYAQFMDQWTPFNKGHPWEDTTYDLRKHLGEPVEFRLS